LDVVNPKNPFRPDVGLALNHQHSTQSIEVWCSHKVLQSDSIPFISTQSVGVLNPPHE